MDFQVKLQLAVDDYNGLIQQEHEIEQQLNTVREQRLQAFGKVQVLNELFQEQLKADSLAQSDTSDASDDTPEA